MSNKQSRRLKPSDKESASVTTSQTSRANMELAEQFEQLRSGLLSELTQAIHAVIRKELDTALAPLKSTLSEISSLYESHEERICGIEATLDQSEQRLVQVEAKLNTVQTENAWLKEKVDDLENRSRRLNLRVVGIPERVEGSNPVAFMTHFFEEIFGKDFFPTPLLLARAHRLGPAKSEANGNQRPRVFIVAFHNFQDKQRIIVQRRQREMEFRGNRVFLHEDVSAELGRKQAAFKEVKALLYTKRVKFRMVYPARLRVLFNSKELHFDTPSKAMAFYREHWGSVASDSPASTEA